MMADPVSCAARPAPCTAAECRDALSGWPKNVPVGNTPCVRAEALEPLLGVPGAQLFLKIEDGPTGTHKDRLAKAHVEEALRRGCTGIVAATCGNFGEALAYHARLRGLPCVIFTAAEENAEPRRVEHCDASVSMLRMRLCHAEVRRETEPGKPIPDYESAVALAKQFCADQPGLYDATPGELNTLLETKTYAQISRELYAQLPGVPDVVAVPCSNGTTLAGIGIGFLQMQAEGWIRDIPRIALGTVESNAILQAVRGGAADCHDLDPASVKDTRLTEVLSNWHCADGNEALFVLRHSRGVAEGATEADMLNCAEQVALATGRAPLPAATSGLITLIRHARELAAGRENPVFVAVITGVVD